MDDVSVCQLCEEPFRVGQDAVGESFYLDRCAAIDPKNRSRIMFMSHQDCGQNARIWRQIKEIKRRLEDLERRPAVDPGRTA